MAEETKKATQQNQVEQNRAGLNNNITGLGDVTPKKAGGSDSGSGSGSNGKNGKNGSQGDSGSGSNGGGVVKKQWEEAQKELQKSIENAGKLFEKTNAENADKKSFNTKAGRTKGGYNSREIVKKEEDSAKRNLERAEQGNEKYQGLVKGGDLLQSIVSKLKPAFKRGDDQLDLNELKGQAAKTGEEAEYYKAIGGTDDSQSIWSWDKSLGTSKEWQARAGELEKQQAEILEKVKRGEDFQNLKKDFDDFSQKMGSMLGYQIDEYGKWAATEGTKNNKYQAEIAMNLFEAINQIGADGKISEDELDIMDSVFEDIGKLAEEERRLDENIQNAEYQYDSAKAKSSYFLLDQIKTWAVFLIGLSQGNPQMVYSAMEQFNKKIADAEAGFTENRIGAFSNNDVKDITSSADAKYAVEQLVPALDKAILDGKLKMNERAQSVQALEMAFEEYQSYVSQGGKEDFAVWFASQSSNGNGWFSIIQSLINAGALNWDTIKDAMKGGSGDGKKTSLLDTPVIDTKLFGGLADSLLAKGNQKPKASKNLRDVQDTVNNAIVASRMGGQKPAPQGVGNAQPVNKSWGFA